jgi:hypothetical protein
MSRPIQWAKSTVDKAQMSAMLMLSPAMNGRPSASSPSSQRWALE